MLALTPQMRILVAVEAVDFRKGIDSLAELCRAKLDADPFSGCLFVFRNRRATSIKVLVYDGQGFWLATKRLSKGRFRWWPQGEGPARALRVHSSSLRTRRTHRAEERGATVGVKMMLPLIFCILPSLFAVILGPAVVRIVNTLLPALGVT